MRAALGVALIALAACGAAPSNGSQGGTLTRDPSWREPNGGRSDSYTPAREPDRSGHTDKAGKGK